MQSQARLPTLLRLPRVMEITGCRRSSIYHAIKKGQFPAPIKIAERAVAWVSSDIERWVAERVGGQA